MVSIAAFSTDFSQEPAVDEEKSKLTGRQEIIPGMKRLAFGGTFWYRGVMPLMEMSQHTDFDVHLSWRFETAPDGHIRTMDTTGEWHDPDIFYQQRWMHIDGAEQFSRARATGQKIVSDLDDDFWALGKTNIAYQTTDPIKNPTFNRTHYWNNLAASDAITVSTDSLRKRVERLGLPTYVLRNAVNLVDWPQNDPTTDGCIGWIGGIQWRSHDLAQLRCANIGQFLEDEGLPIYHGGDSQHTSAEVVRRRTVDHNAWVDSLPEDAQAAFRGLAPQMPETTVPKFWEQMGINPDRVRCLAAPLVPIWEYPRLWEPLNISLVPLEQVPFNHAKSWLKSLESCAAGVPYIVSAKFPEQDLLISEGSAGRTARNDKPQQWIDHLYELLDPDVRRVEGMINRQIAEKHNIADRWVEWNDVYEKLV